MGVRGADIKACFDEIDHDGPDGPCARPDRRQACPGLGEGALNAGVLTEEAPQTARRSPAHPKAASSHRCWPTSPCPSSTSTSEPNGLRWVRRGHAQGVVPGTSGEARPLRGRLRGHGPRHPPTPAPWGEVAGVLAPMGLRLSEEKTRSVCHLDERFDFPGWHIQRRARRGRAGKRAVYTYLSKKSLLSVMDKVRTSTLAERDIERWSTCCAG